MLLITCACLVNVKCLLDIDKVIQAGLPDKHHEIVIVYITIFCN